MASIEAIIPPSSIEPEPSVRSRPDGWIDADRIDLAPDSRPKTSNGKAFTELPGLQGKRQTRRETLACDAGRATH